MLKELLGDLYTEEIAKKLEGKELAVINDGSYLPRKKLDEVNAEVRELKKQLSERDGQLKDLGERAAGNEALQKQIADLQEANKKTVDEHEAKLAKIRLDFAVEKALTGAKAKNIKAVLANLDMEKVKLDGETLTGLDEQLTALVKAEPYLFAEGKVGQGSNPPGGGGNHEKTPEEMSMEEYAAFWNKRQGLNS